jgi:hypothetical protein
MAHDWAQDVKKYVADPDDGMKGIIRHCGIALQSRGCAVRRLHRQGEAGPRARQLSEKKLALTGSDADLDNAVMEVCQKMKADRDKSRVAFYYLLAEKYGKLTAFH